MTAGTQAGRREGAADPLVLSGWLLLAALAILLLASAWQGPDIFYHLFLGKRVLETRAFQPADPLLVPQPKYVNIYWLFQVVVHGLYAAAGPVGVTLLMMAGWLAALWTWLRTARWHRLPAVGMPFAVGALFVLQNRFDPRPEVVSYLFLALHLHWLATWDFDRRLRWREHALFAASQILWTNVHGYFVLGPLLVGLRLVAAFFQGDRRRPLGEMGRLFLVVLAASFVSPFGWKGWGFAWTLWTFLREMRNAIVETRPPLGEALRLWTVKLFWAYWGLTALAGIWLLVRRRFRLFPLLTGLVALYLGATGARNLPLLFFLSGPLWGAFVESWLRRAGRAQREPERTERRPVRVEGEPEREGRGAEPKERPTQTAARGSAGARAAVAGTAVLAAASCVWVGTNGFHRSVTSPSRFGIALQPHAYPLRFAAYLRAHPFRGKLYNNASDGGFLEYSFPDVRPYIDSRYVEAEPVKRYFASLRDPSVFAELHRQHGFDGALLSLSESPRLVAALLSGPEWRLCHADLHRAFFVRADSPAAAGLEPDPPRFYAGDDLSRPVNGRPAIEWTVLLVRAKQTELLREALRQLAAAPRVPSVVVQYGLGYGLQEKDAEIVDRARALYPKAIAATEQDRSVLERLMRQAMGAPPRTGS